MHAHRRHVFGGPHEMGAPEAAQALGLQAEAFVEQERLVQTGDRDRGPVGEPLLPPWPIRAHGRAR